MKRTALLFILALLLCACQPTPEQEFVISKADVTEEEVLLKTAEPVERIDSESHETLAERLGAPAHWTEEEFSAKIPFDATLTVHIDADVHVPDAERIGVYTVTFDVPFSETQQKGLLLKFLGEQETPFQVDKKGNGSRKWQIEDQIRYFQHQLETYQQADDAEMREVMTRQTEEQLEMTMKRYREAPEDWEHIAWNGSVLSGNGTDAGSMTLYSSTEQPAHYRWMNFSAYSLEYRDETLPLTENWMDFRSPEKNVRSAVRSEPTTDAERAAAALALETVNGLGIGTFTLKSVSQGMDGFDGLETGAAESGYWVRLWLTKNLLPIYCFQAWHGDDPARERAEKAGYLEERDYNVYTPEQVTAAVGVRDGKIAYLDLSGLHHETGCVNDNVQLLPFAKIAQIFKDQIAYHYFVGGDDPSSDGDAGTQLHITDVYLSMMRVRKKDSPNEFYLLPVWDFGFYVEDKFRGFVAERGMDLKNTFCSYSTLTINAVDGTIIDRNTGY